MQTQSFFQDLPEAQAQEVFQDILRTPHVRIERIVSHGQTSPVEGWWYDQDEHEWVLLLQGCAVLAFDDGSETCLQTGDYIHIPAHRRHRVAMTDPDGATVWLAVFYR